MHKNVSDGFPLVLVFQMAIRVLMVRVGLGEIPAVCQASIRDKQMQRWLKTAVSLLHFFTEQLSG